jgi:hypothetical protein
MVSTPNAAKEAARARMAVTGENYATALRHVIAEHRRATPATAGLASWRQLASDADVQVAASVWADPAAPVVVLAKPPQRVLEYLTTDFRLLAAVLDNTAVPDIVKNRLARLAKGESRKFVAEHALFDQDSVRLWAVLAPALTPGALERAVGDLMYSARRDGQRQGAAASGRPQVREILKAFATSSDAHCRALAAQAFPLGLSPRHQFAKGYLSAPRLAADPDVGVRVALARNYEVRQLPEDSAGLAVRRALLEDPAPRVRTAARRAGLQLLDSRIDAFLNGAWESQSDSVKKFLPSDALDDPAASVRATVLQGGIVEQDVHRWERVARDPSPQVRAAVATHGFWAPPLVWQELATDGDAQVRKAVALSRWAPAGVLSRLLADTDPSVAAAVRARDPAAGRAGATAKPGGDDN